MLIDTRNDCWKSKIYLLKKNIKKSTITSASSVRKTLKEKKHYFVLILVLLGVYKHLPLYVVGFEVYCDVVFVLQRFSDISRLMFLIFHCYCWPSLLFQQRPSLGSCRILVMCSVKVCFSALIFTQVSSIYLKVAGVLARWLCVSYCWKHWKVMFCLKQ